MQTGLGNPLGSRSFLCVGVAIGAALVALGCTDNNDPANSDPNDLELLTQVLETNAELAVAMYSDSIDTVEDLRTALVTLAADPSEQTLAAARRAWLVAQEPYGYTEVYRFRQSPIDDRDYLGPGEEGRPELDINSWPLGEALIDYVVAGTDFGDDQIGITGHDTGVPDPIPDNNIINATDIPINRALLDRTVATEDERDVISGYHAIEFLLWGQDVNENGSADTLGQRDSTPGQRPYTDFVADVNCTSGDVGAEPVICERRGQFLQVAVDKLIDDLTEVRDAWQPGAPYRDAFTNPEDLDGAKRRFLEILTGMGTMAEGELAGERMQIALSVDSQEDEHSCFSDNTHRDILTNAEGIYSLFRGDYEGYDGDLDGTIDVTSRAVQGYGIDDYLQDLGLDEIADEANQAFLTAREGYEAVDAMARAGMPIDNIIADPLSDDARPMREAIVALNGEAQQLVRIAAELEIGTADQVIDDDASACDTTDPTSEC